MAVMTEASTAKTVASGSDASAGESAVPARGLAAVLGTTSSVAIGRMYVIAAALFLLIGRGSSLVVSAENIDPSEATIMRGYGLRFLSLASTADLYLFLLPAFIGLAIAIVPLQIGSPTIAFPRAAAASFWVWLLSSGLLLGSYLARGGSPLDNAGRDDGILLWLVGLGGIAVALCLASACVAASVLGLRTAGMTVDKVPTFTFASLVGATINLLTLPVVGAALIYNYVSVQHDVTNSAPGYLVWAVGVAATFSFAIPTLGFVLDAVATATGVPIRNRGVLLGAIGVAGILTYAGDSLNGGNDPSIFLDALLVGGAFALVLPLLAILGGVADTIRRGKVTVSSPLLFAVLSLLAFVLAAGLNAARVVEPLHLIGTSADNAVITMTLVAGLLGVVGAASYWSTKLFGSVSGEAFANIGALLIFLGGVVSSASAFAAGTKPFEHQFAGLAFNPDAPDGLEALNLATVVGGVLIILGLALVVANILTARGSTQRDVPSDPWGGHTLEWATSSPPAVGGVGPIAPVISATPLYAEVATEVKA